LGVNWALGREDDNGITDRPTVHIIEDSNGVDIDFSGVTNLNPWVLRHSTREFIATTIIHELFHSYIEYVIKEALEGANGFNIDTIRAMFPYYTS
jgi:hypothetical protein